MKNFKNSNLGIFFFSLEATALLCELLLLFAALAGASSPTPEFNNFLYERRIETIVRDSEIKLVSTLYKAPARWPADLFDLFDVTEEEQSKLCGLPERVD